MCHASSRKYVISFLLDVSQQAECTYTAKEGGKEPVDKVQQAVQASQMRVLTDEDFRKIDAARLSKEVTALRRGKKRPAEEETSSR
jgi:hypothetical protein